VDIFSFLFIVVFHLARKDRKSLFHEEKKYEDEDRKDEYIKEHETIPIHEQKAEWYI
jgi:hypothetical protein